MTKKLKLLCLISKTKALWESDSKVPAKPVANEKPQAVRESENKPLSEIAVGSEEAEGQGCLYETISMHDVGASPAHLSQEEENERKSILKQATAFPVESEVYRLSKQSKARVFSDVCPNSGL